MPLDITLRQLRAFITVLESGSFSEAAQTMHLSQAALSGLVKELESRLGVRLLDRNTRSVGASVVGAAFEPMARRVLAATEEAVESVTNLKDLRRGLVRVAAPEPLSCSLLPELIAGYSARYPGIDTDAFARAWRSGYLPAIDRVRLGEREWALLDTLHREILDEILPRFGLGGLSEPEREELNRVWHRLDPWPDSLGALARLNEIMPPGHRPVVHLTLTDDHPYAQAFVIIEALPE